MKRQPDFLSAASFFLPTVVICWMFLPAYKLRMRIACGVWSIGWVILFQHLLIPKFGEPLGRIFSGVMLLSSVSFIGFGLYQLFLAIRSKVGDFKAESLMEESGQYFEQIETTGKIPEVIDQHMNLRPGEFIAYRGFGTVYEFRTSGISYSEGRFQRNLFGAGGVFRGKSVRDMNETNLPAGMGTLYITNQRVILVGERKQYDRRLDQIITTRVDGKVLSLAVEGLQRPISIKVDNPYIPLGYQRLLKDFHLDTPFLPSVAQS